MKNLKFTKMQGAGNDYVYINGFTQKIDNPSKLAIELSNRNFGVGSDGLIMVLPSSTCDCRMQMFNADGSESEMCGNGVRCVAKFAFDKGLVKTKQMTVETGAGVKYITILDSNIKKSRVKVDMGEPILDPVKIPVNAQGNPVMKYPIDVDGKTWEISCVSMGNPHAVIFMEGINDLDLPVIGPKFENHLIFPRRTNTEFVEVVDRKTLNMRVWERGTGETLACGTGACASVVAAILNGYCDRKVTIHLLGGDLEIEWDEKNNRIYMTGDAVTVFEGEIV